MRLSYRNLLNGKMAYPTSMSSVYGTVQYKIGEPRGFPSKTCYVTCVSMASSEL